MSPPVLRVALIGHTNTGKTSLVRTLLRDVAFGEVSDRPGTTRDVAGRSIFVQGRRAIELFDTPGLEDSSGLLDALDELAERGEGRRTSGHDRLLAFLRGPLAEGRFSQEAKAIREVLDANVALYVIDARDPVLGKHRDELEILGFTGRPVVPVLNFVASEQARTELWREALKRVGLHAIVEFDTVVLDAASEERLFEKIETLVDEFRPTIQALLKARREERARLLEASCRTVAEMLVDAASLAMPVETADAAAAEQAVERFRDVVRERERRCVEELLELHRFRPGDWEADDVPVEGGRWGLDLFSPASMQKYGLRAGGGAGAGAIIGLSVDAALGGASLGAGAAVGAAIGAVAGAIPSSGRRLFDRLRGRNELRLQPDTVVLLALRETDLARALFRRGHAAQTPVTVRSPRADAPGPRATLGRLRRLARRCAAYPEWSRLSDHGPRPAPVLNRPARDAAAREFAELVRSLLAAADEPAGRARA